MKKTIIVSLILSLLLSLLPVSALADGSVATATSGAFSAGDGTAENPYRVGTPEQLWAVRENLSAHYIQVADIDLGGIAWIPIGGETLYGDTEAFEGVYDGNGFIISNMSIDTIDIYHMDLGLFGYNQGTLKNISLVGVNIDINISEKSFPDADGAYMSIDCGGIAATGGGLIENSSVDGSMRISCNINQQNYEGPCPWIDNIIVGGIIGFGYSQNCINYADVMVVGKADTYDIDVYCGGIFGYTERTDATISNCLNFGNINSSADGLAYAGGISGGNGSIHYSINKGNISSNSSSEPGGQNVIPPSIAGGIASFTAAELSSNCVNLGNVTAHAAHAASGSSAGGIAGCVNVYSTSRLENCYNLGNSIHADETVPDDPYSSIFSFPATCVGAIYGYCYYFSEGVVTNNCYTIDSVTLSNIAVGTVLGYDGALLSEQEIISKVEEVLRVLGLTYQDISDGTVPPGDGSTQENVRFLSKWDDEIQTAYFGWNDFAGCRVTEKTDASTLSKIESLVGTYVWVETEPSDDVNASAATLLCIYPAETNVGTVTYADNDSIIVGGVTYSVPQNISLPSALVDKQVVYHLYQGKLVGIETLEVKKGVLRSWNSVSKVLSIDPEGIYEPIADYKLSHIADKETIDFLGMSSMLLSSDVKYLVDEYRNVYHIELTINQNSPGNYFELGKDNNTFAHNEYSFFAEGEQWSYLISDKYFELLLNRGDIFEDQLLRDERNGDKWVGACFGLAATLVVACNGGLQDITQGRDYASLPQPNNVDNAPDLRNVIHYYHLLQNLIEPNIKSYASSISNLTKSGVSLEAFLKAFVAEAKESELLRKPFVFGYNYVNSNGTPGGHAIVVCGYEEFIKNGTRVHRIKVFNENDWYDYKYEFIDVEYDYSNFTYVNYNSSTASYEDNSSLRNNYTILKFYDIDVWDVEEDYRCAALHSRAYALSSTNTAPMVMTQSVPAETVRIAIPAFQQFSLLSEDGYTLNYDGKNYGGTLPVYDVRIVGFEGQYIIFTVDICEQYIITEFGNSFELIVDLGNVCYTASVEHSNSITLSHSDGIQLGGANYNFTTGISVSGAPCDLIEISGSADGICTVKPLRNGVSLDTTQECIVEDIKVHRGTSYDVHTLEQTASTLSVSFGEDGTVDISCHQEDNDVHVHTADDLQNDGTYHWHVCSCGEVFNKEAHHYTNEANDVCEKCGYENSVATRPSDPGQPDAPTNPTETIKPSEPEHTDETDTQSPINNMLWAVVAAALTVTAVSIVVIRPVVVKQKKQKKTK